MEVVRYEPGMLAELTDVYNRATGCVPHCYPVSAARLGEELAGAREEPEGRPRLASQRVFVAREGGAAVGFLHAAVGRFGEHKTEQGIIRFLWYERGRRKAGGGLLDQAEEFLRRQGVPRVEAFPEECAYPFYHAGDAYLSNRLDHVQALLAVNGYRRMEGEVFLDWPDFEPLKPGPAGVTPAITVERGEKPGRRPDVSVVARLDGSVIGVCNSLSLAARGGGDEADEWVFTDWLGVEDEHQRKGLGLLLLRRALVEARELGYRHAAISTDWMNHRAFLFYSNFGYRVVDWTYGFARDIGGTPA